MADDEETQDAVVHDEPSTSSPDPESIKTPTLTQHVRAPSSLSTDSNLPIDSAHDEHTPQSLGRDKLGDENVTEQMAQTPTDQLQVLTTTVEPSTAAETLVDEDPIQPIEPIDIDRTPDSTPTAAPIPADLQPPISPTPSEKPVLITRNTSDGIKSKMSSSLSWLSRAANMRKPSTGSPTRPPPSAGSAGSSRPHTGASDPIGTHSPARSPESLQDRFLSLRLQEESAAAAAASEYTDEAVQSPLSQNPEPLNPAPTGRRASCVQIPVGRDDKLPPGTAAGVSIGPATEEEGPVNWDLWQTLVQEGPMAVSRTSGEQLNRAIKSGIPQPIRGVVWQILAQSKNESLENVYNELVSRVSDQQSSVRSPPLSRTESNSGVATVNTEKESLASSASSIHSQSSTPATSAMTVSPIPTSVPTTNEELSKVQGTLVVEKTRRTIENSASLQKLEKAIRRDLGARTSYSKFVASAGMQESLFRVCKAYALYDEPVGYAQGMNFIAMPLLFNMPEEEAFSLMVRLMSNYDLRSMFTANMTGLHLRLYQFERLLEDYEPALYCHLHRREVIPNIYATQWFLTLFAYRFPLQLVLRIYDLVLSEGLSAILKFGIVLMRKNAQTLLGMKDMSHLTTFLKEKVFDVYIDKSPSASSILESGFFGSAGGIDKDIYHADALIRDACAIQISPETLNLYASEFETQALVERDRLNELETLRTSNAALAGRVRALEAQTQQRDMEHVGIASDLVRIKVENETLNDTNESLRIKVDELQKMIDTQPAEVEARLKEEMDRIMARNIEVQNSNRELEEANEDMEQQLVTTKLENAELNADRDALKQKIWGIQNMLGEAKI